MRGMTTIVKTVAGWVGGLIVLYGVYIFLYGHLTPGGGFAGGVILACALVLFTLAFGRRAQEGAHGGAAATLDCIGALAFLGVALLGLLRPLGGRFFVNFLQRLAPGEAYRLASAGTIPVSNAAIALKVAASLLAVFLVLSAFESASGRGEDEEEGAS